MSTDVVVADVTVWLAAHGVLVMAAGLLLLSVSLFFWSPRIGLIQENRQLRADVEEAREASNTALEIADQALADQVCLRADLREVRLIVQTAQDRLACVEMELSTEWEVEPR